MRHRDTFLGYGILLWVLSVAFLSGPDIYRIAGAQVTTIMGNVVGVTASIPPNEWNSLAQQFEMREQELDERARALSAREQSILSILDDKQRERERRMYWYLSVLTGALLALLSVNYYLDFHRKEQIR